MARRRKKTKMDISRVKQRNWQPNR